MCELKEVTRGLRRGCVIFGIVDLVTAVNAWVRSAFPLLAMESPSPTPSFTIFVFLIICKKISLRFLVSFGVRYKYTVGGLKVSCEQWSKRRTICYTMVQAGANCRTVRFLPLCITALLVKVWFTRVAN